jgi:ribonuclease Z
LKRIIGVTAALIAALALGAWAAFRLSPALQDAVVARAAVARGSQMPVAEDSLRVLLCGTSSPMPDHNAAKACTLVVAGGQWVLVDIGPEATENLNRWRLPIARIGTVLLTHFHSDHIGELGEFNMQGWAQGRVAPLQVFGPEGVEQVVGGFNAAYALDRGYRHAHHDHGRGLMPLAAGEMQPRAIGPFKAGEAPQGRRSVVFERDGLVVTAIEVDHRPVTPALAYRFDYRGRSVVITGDTVYYPPLAAAARGADLMVSEAESHELLGILAEGIAATGDGRLAGVLRDTASYHLTPVQAAKMANEAGVRELVYTHIAPPILVRPMAVPWLRGVHEVRPDGVRLGHDGLLATIPLDGGPLRFSTLGD